MKTIGNTINIPGPLPGSRIGAFCAHPEGDGAWPAVIVYFDAPGMREELHDMAMAQRHRVADLALKQIDGPLVGGDLRQRATHRALLTEDLFDLLVGQAAFIGELDVAVVGVPGRHASIQHDLFDHRRPTADLGVARKGKRPDLSGAMAFDAVLLEKRLERLRSLARGRVSREGGLAEQQPFEFVFVARVIPGSIVAAAAVVLLVLLALLVLFILLDLLVLFRRHRNENA